MQCPEFKPKHIRKNGQNRQGKQNYICADCHRQFIDSDVPVPYRFIA